MVYIENPRYRCREELVGELLVVKVHVEESLYLTMQAGENLVGPN
jgi:hypothetical protein